MWPLVNRTFPFASLGKMLPYQGLNCCMEPSVEKFISGRVDKNQMNKKDI